MRKFHQKFGAALPSSTSQYFVGLSYLVCRSYRLARLLSPLALCWHPGSTTFSPFFRRNEKYLRPIGFTVARSTMNILLALENESRFELRKLERSYIIGINERPSCYATLQYISVVSCVLCKLVICMLYFFENKIVKKLYNVMTALKMKEICARKKKRKRIYGKA